MPGSTALLINIGLLSCALGREEHIERMTTGNPSKLGTLRLQHYLVMAGVAAAVLVACLRYMPAAGAAGYAFLSVATSSGAGPALAEGSRATAPPADDPSVIIFNFGDSNSDTGGMAAVNGMNIQLPEGRTFFRRPSGRLSDGRLVIDFICESSRSHHLA
jgi:hypothetical protein